MKDQKDKQKSQLTAILREGVGVVQMIVFKELRTSLTASHEDRDPAYISMLAGAVTNELFGSPNSEERFLNFRNDNKGVIEQELLAFSATCPQLIEPLTDALRVQAICDSQEGVDSSRILTRASELGFLLLEREVPLPSAFMTLVRNLGQEHNLIIPPVPIDPEMDKIVH